MKKHKRREGTPLTDVQCDVQFDKAKEILQQFKGCHNKAKQDHAAGVVIGR